MVAIQFLPNPENKPCVNHKDGDKTNNHVDNLEWSTYSENINHAFENGLIPIRRGEDNPWCKYSNESIHHVCKLLQEGYRNIEVHEITGIPKYIIKNIKMKNSWVEISSQYKFPERSRLISEDTVRWICKMICEGYTNTEIVSMSTNSKVNKSVVSKIKTRRSYINISKDYNF